MADQASDRRCLILHILPEDLSRGAQSFARALRDLLDEQRGLTHRTLTLFDAPAAALEADISLGVDPRPWRSCGLHPVAVWKLRRYIRASRPSVVVAHGGEPLKYVWAAHVNEPPVIYNKIGMFGFDDDAVLRRWLHRHIIRRADVVAGVSSEALAQVPGVVGADGPELRLVPNGRDDAVYRPGLHSPGRRPRLIYVGQVSPEKRPDLFVEVAASLRAEGLDFDAVLAGGGAVPDSLARAAEDAAVDLLGRRDDVPALLAASDVLVLPSDTEGMPGAVIEAGLCGLPVVATAVPGVADVVVDGETGYIVPRGDAAALTAACARLLADPGLRARMGAAARDRCVAEFTLAASARRWQAIFDDLMRREETYA